MKRLVLVRHSKAEDDAPNDFERKLTIEGKKLAKIVALNISFIPSRNANIMTSPAPRALETAKIFSENISFYNNKVSKDEFLYKYFTHDRFLMWIDSQKENEELWVSGHNPMFSEIVSYLTDGKIYSMPKCAVAAFEIDVNNWFETTPENSKLLFFENPKNYK